MPFTTKIQNFFKTRFSRNLKILSCDGGGIKGLFTIKLISLIEKEFDIKFYDKFDIFAGTSTGSIIAAGLATNIPTEEIVEIYKSQAEKIFSKYSMSFGGLTKSKYDHQHFTKLLDKKFGGKTFDNLDKQLFITSVNITAGQPQIFSNERGDIKIKDAIMASASPPLYFNPHRINQELFVDGGVWANNPTSPALIYSMDTFDKPLKRIKICSIGTGEGAGPYFTKQQEKSRDWGLAKWERKLFRLFTDSPSLGSSQLIEKILPEKNYIRLNHHEQKFIMLDDLKKIPQLEAAAEKTFYERKDDIRRFVRKL